ncbi:hypothetical protein [Delftia sp. PS-11]|uniref:hypothetical protein n=1 Tax=Delftia sp. PS-11 TaxID=2767222 RepID=UPI002456B4AA|nr:hypothetical protein [Delftia sp. PS-11]KAJ8745527.1 hypothetical protein H9T68_06960 [Delftia sp. PS-11]
MQTQWIRSLQLGLGAAALCMAGLAAAQPAAAAAGSTPPPAVAGADQGKPGPQHQHEHKKHHHGKKHHHQDRMESMDHKGHGKGYDRNDPAQREAAAVREQSRRGGVESGGGMDQFQRNALARCDVFKSEADRRSCVGRVKDGQASGSIEGGGLLREYTEQVLVPR